MCSRIKLLRIFCYIKWAVFWPLTTIGGKYLFRNRGIYAVLWIILENAASILWELLIITFYTYNASSSYFYSTVFNEDSLCKVTIPKIRKSGNVWYRHTRWWNCVKRIHSKPTAICFATSQFDDVDPVVLMISNSDVTLGFPSKLSNKVWGYHDNNISLKGSNLAW